MSIDPFDEIITEMGRAFSMHPNWPTDPVHALAVVAEELGECQKEVVQLTYEPHKSTPESLRKEAVQLVAFAVRFLMSLDQYEFKPSGSHVQK